MEARGRQTRRLTTSRPQEVRLDRSYAVCRPVGANFSPLDEELALPGGRLSSYVLESVVRLATWMPFGRAVQGAAWFTGVTVSETRRGLPHPFRRVVLAFHYSLIYHMLVINQARLAWRSGNRL